MGAKIILSKDPNLSMNFISQLPRNLFANLIYFLANISIGVLLVPYFISNLGVAAYGIIPLITSITGYVAIVVQSLNTAVSRFLTVDLQREDYMAANRTFNTSLLGLSTVIIMMCPVVLAVAWFIPSIFHIPAGQEKSVIYLFLGVCASFLIRSWTGTFTVQLFAFNRLDLQNFVNISNLLTQTGLIILFFSLFGPDLSFVGGAYLAGAIMASGVSIILSHRVCPYLSFSIQFFDRSRIKNLCEMGWWVIINQVGSLFFLSIDLILVNLLFGATSAGEYAIAIQWVILLRAIAGMLSSVLTPTIVSYYARGQTEALILITKRAVKLMGLAVALPIGLVCGFGPQLLTIWVGPIFTFLAPLMIVLTMHLSINLAVLPIFSINVAYNKVRIPGIVTLIMGVGNIILAVTLSQLTSWGYYSVAIAGAIILTTKNAFFIPWYATRVLEIEGQTFSLSILSGLIAAVLVSILAAILAASISLTNLDLLAIACVFITFLYIGAVWLLCLSGFERKVHNLCRDQDS